MLVRMPKGLTIKKLGELAKKYFPNNVDGYRMILPDIIDEIGEDPADESAWLLMRKDLFPFSMGKNYDTQRHIVATLSMITGIPYEVPSILQAVTCVLAEYSRSQNRLFSETEWTYTICKEVFKGYPIYVGGFTSDGLFVHVNRNGFSTIGVAILRKL